MALIEARDMSQTIAAGCWALTALQPAMRRTREVRGVRVAYLEPAFLVRVDRNRFAVSRGKNLVVVDVPELLNSFPVGARNRWERVASNVYDGWASGVRDYFHHGRRRVHGAGRREPALLLISLKTRTRGARG